MQNYKPFLTSKSIVSIFIAGMLLGIILVSSGPSGVKSTQADYAPIEQTRSYISKPEVDCLAKTIFFEARNESLAGKLAVGLVVLNRTESDKFPQTVCSVVKQGRYTGTSVALEATPNSKYCQFSWYCDGITDKPEDIIAKSRQRQHLKTTATTREEVVWQQSQEIARVILERKVFDFTDEATHYHASRIHPRWADGLEKIGQIDAHTFYREK